MLEVKVQFYFEENKVSRNKILTSRVLKVVYLISLVFYVHFCMRFFVMFSTITLRGL